MSSFKPGDWVVNTTTDDYYDGIRNWFQLKETDLIFKQGVNATEWESNFKFVNSHEIWQPETGEWCWFWNKETDVPILSKLSDITNYEDLPTIYYSEHPMYIKLGEDDDYKIVESYNFNNCEPFIGLRINHE